MLREGEDFIDDFHDDIHEFYIAQCAGLNASAGAPAASSPLRNSSAKSFKKNLPKYVLKRYIFWLCFRLGLAKRKSIDKGLYEP